MPISDVSELAHLLDEHHALERRLKRVGQWKALGAAVLTLLGSFGGAVWSVRGYLETIATKVQVQELVSGQQLQISDQGKHITTCENRNNLQDERLSDVRTDIKEVRSDIKELQGRAGTLVRGRP